MMKKNRNNLRRMLALLLVAALMLPLSAAAAQAGTVQPQANQYLGTNTCGMETAGVAKVKVKFNAKGTQSLNELGVSRIRIHQSDDGSSWFWAKDYTPSNTTGLTGYNVSSHSGSVIYNATTGRYYKAEITFRGKQGTTVETETKWTGMKQAT